MSAEESGLKQYSMQLSTQGLNLPTNGAISFVDANGKFRKQAVASRLIKSGTTYAYLQTKQMLIVYFYSVLSEHPFMAYDFLDNTYADEV